MTIELSIYQKTYRRNIVSYIHDAEMFLFILITKFLAWISEHPVYSLRIALTSNDK